jgi:hypothetical protein
MPHARILHRFPNVPRLSPRSPRGVAQIDAEKSPYLTEKLKIWMLPTLALIKNEKVVEYLVGLDDLGGVEDFKQASLCLALAAHGVLHYEGESPAAMPSRSAVQRKVRSTRTLDSSDEDSDFD